MDFVCQVTPPPTPVLQGQYQAGWYIKQSQMKIICPFYFVLQVLTLFRMGLFGAARGCGEEGAKSSPLYNLSHVSYIDENWHSSTVPKSRI